MGMCSYNAAHRTGWSVCETCGGEGEIPDYPDDPCYKCDGDGVLWNENDAELAMADLSDDGGDCYVAAIDLMCMIPRELEPRLVHATVTGQGPIAGVRFGHAWVEIGQVAFDFSNGREIAMRAGRYREIGEASDVREYTRTEAAEHIRRTEHAGPWE